MSDNPLEQLRALARTRPELGQRVALALTEVSAALVAADASARTRDEAIAGYDGQEPDRVMLQAAASAAVPPHGALADAIAQLATVAGELRQGDERIARAALAVEDPARVAAASVQTAQAILKPEKADGWAAGEPSFNEARDFVNAHDAHASASAYRRCSGAKCPEVARVIFFLELIEALARRNRVPVVRLWEAAEWPKMTPNAIVDWVQRASERPEQPAVAANILAVCARIRAAVADGVRTAYDFEAWERDRLGERALAAPTPETPARRLASEDATHYGVRPESTGGHAIQRPTDSVQAVAATAESIAPTDEAPRGVPAIPDFVRETGADRYLR